MPSKDIYYSDKYTDDKFEYRHVMLPKVNKKFKCFFFMMKLSLTRNDKCCVTSKVYIEINGSNT